MKDFILLMQADATREAPPESWERYFAKLRALGVFEGGSSIGAGTTLRKEGTPGPSADHLTGYIRVRAESLEAAQALVGGNPVYGSGGSVEVRELPRD